MHHIGKPIEEACSAIVIIHRHFVVGVELELPVESSKVCIDSTCSVLREIKISVTKTCQVSFSKSPYSSLSLSEIHYSVDILSIGLSLIQNFDIAKKFCPRAPFVLHQSTSGFGNGL
jgi:hypothetical protein